MNMENIKKAVAKHTEADTDKIEISGKMLKQSGISGTPLDVFLVNSAVVLLKRRMTAYDIVNAIDSLQKLADTLTEGLEKICGECSEDECTEYCPMLKLNCEDITLPENLLLEAGIPTDAKLRASADRESGCVVIFEADHAHDLRDVPENVLDNLEMRNVCFARLEQLLMEDNLIYGD